MAPKEYLKLNLKNKIIVSSLIFIIAIFCLIFLIVLPTIKEIKSISEDIEAQREDLEKKYIAGQDSKQLAENLEKIKPQLDLINKIFINKNRELEFITSLENEANKNRINQKINLNAPEEVINQPFQKNVLQLSSEGSFIDLLQYLMNLEYLNYYINIKSLELTSTSGGGQNFLPYQNNNANNINLSINADTYWSQ